MHNESEMINVLKTVGFAYKYNHKTGCAFLQIHHPESDEVPAAVKEILQRSNRFSTLPYRPWQWIGTFQRLVERGPENDFSIETRWNEKLRRAEVRHNGGEWLGDEVSHQEPLPYDFSFQA